jgi:hypothetical protein
MSCGVRLEVISGLTVHMHRRIWVRFGMSSDNNFAELLWIPCNRCRKCYTFLMGVYEFIFYACTAKQHNILKAKKCLVKVCTALRSTPFAILLFLSTKRLNGHLCLWMNLRLYQISREILLFQKVKQFNLMFISCIAVWSVCRHTDHTVHVTKGCLRFHVTHKDTDAPWGWHVGAETCRSRIAINIYWRTQCTVLVFTRKWNSV